MKKQNIYCKYKYKILNMGEESPENNMFPLLSKLPC